MKKLFALLIIFAFVKNNHAQINYSQFMPLSVGNIWVYSCSALGNYCLCNKKIKIEVTGIDTIDNKHYYQVTRNDYSSSCYIGCSYMGFPGFPGFIRIDTLTSNLLMYTTNAGCNYLINEYLQDSFKARLNDSIRFNCRIMQGEMYYRCLDTSNMNIFGQSRQSRWYQNAFFEAGSSRRYVYGIGLYSASYSVMYCAYQTSTLIGCVIDGVLYGDTSTILGLKRINSQVPEEYSLYQNYPNPFNPITKIKFDIRLPLLSKEGTTGVVLRIYDILGREVVTLVNEQLKPGTYEVEWPAPSEEGSNYSSGVYYYQLISDEFIQTKKMVLIK